MKIYCPSCLDIIDLEVEYPHMELIGHYINKHNLIVGDKTVWNETEKDIIEISQKKLNELEEKEIENEFL